MTWTVSGRPGSRQQQRKRGGQMQAPQRARLGLPPAASRRSPSRLRLRLRLRHSHPASTRQTLSTKPCWQLHERRRAHAAAHRCPGLPQAL